jgi:hypothetical protein
MSQFTVEEYARGLGAIRTSLHPRDHTILRTQYAARGRAITAKELAVALGYKNWRPVNPVYSNLGWRLATAMDRQPETAGKGEYAWWRVLSAERWVGGRCIWTMHEELARALEEVGICEAAPVRAL